uniref:Secreted protein n=1 Tax=Steinernema glaseri TaxID=37863 RepID=A0A1I7XYQ3_9BILA
MGLYYVYRHRIFGRLIPLTVRVWIVRLRLRSNSAPGVCESRVLHLSAILQCLDRQFITRSERPIQRYVAIAAITIDILQFFCSNSFIDVLFKFLEAHRSIQQLRLSY